MKILITTQYTENYGTLEEPYWKLKGGEDYFITDFHGSEEDATKVVMANREKIEYSNLFSKERIIDFFVVPDDFISEFERQQLEYEGKVTFPAKILEIV